MPGLRLASLDLLEITVKLLVSSNSFFTSGERNSRGAGLFLDRVKITRFVGENVFIASNLIVSDGSKFSAGGGLYFTECNSVNIQANSVFLQTFLCSLML